MAREDRAMLKALLSDFGLLLTNEGIVILEKADKGVLSYSQAQKEIMSLYDRIYMQIKK